MKWSVHTQPHKVLISETVRIPEQAMEPILSSKNIIDQNKWGNNNSNDDNDEGEEEREQA